MAEPALPDTLPTVNIAVRQMVEFLLRAGDYRSEFTGSNRGVSGTRGHQAVQKRRPEGYRSEVPVSYEIDREGFHFVIAGRIDGILPTDPFPTLEEIKTTDRPLATVTGENPVHWAQAEVYAYILAEQENLSQLEIMLTYYQIDDGLTVEFRRTRTQDELRDNLFRLLDDFAAWCRFTHKWANARKSSLIGLTFPFSGFRPGQRQLATAVYRAVRDHRRLFVNAPTGIGKTMGALFPALKALGEDQVAKVFYLTAKTTGQSVAENALSLLREGGMQIKALTLTAKEKICFEPDAACLPEECPYAEGFFDRLRPALETMDESDRLDREWIESTARRFRICPFEFALEVALWSDVVICDYNYAFDPRASLKRFFQETTDPYVFLVDEAHNLPDRARDMFSATLHKQTFSDFRAAWKLAETTPCTKLTTPTRAFNSLKKELDPEKERILESIPAELADRLRTWQKPAEQTLLARRGAPWRNQLLELFFEVAFFLRIGESLDSDYAIRAALGGRDVAVELRCLDPARLLSEACEHAVATVFFSGTLLPMEFFRRILGGRPDDPTLIIPSPFPRENREVVAMSSVSTRYRQRLETAPEVATAIQTVLSAHPGNYLVFFPSYQYMETILALLPSESPDTLRLVQSREMDDASRAAFLSAFEATDSPVVGFAVMGGVFAEGIDLVGERLVGAIMVGVGLPQIGMERDLIRDYFDRRGESGFEFAYQFPGLNRVMQAGGRVIRSETDRGVIILIDERFAQYRYRQYLPQEWKPLREIGSIDGLQRCLEKFWENK